MLASHVEVGDAGVLHTGGYNGFLVVMVLLYWWGKTEGSALWSARVGEAKRCLERMTSLKRPLDMIDSSARKAARTS
jgi:hypothetical protein